MPDLVVAAIKNFDRRGRWQVLFTSFLWRICVFPLGLVPKHTPGEWKMLHHLSYPEGASINDGIPLKFACIAYENLDHALGIIAQLGRGCYIAKLDIKSAFYNLLIHPEDYHLLGFS